MLKIFRFIGRSILLSFLKLLPETRAFSTKRKVYNLLGCEIGKGTKICSSAKFYLSGKLIVGKSTWIGLNVFIVTSGKGIVKIGNNVRIGPQVYIGTGTHEINFDGPSIAGKGINKTVIIGDGVWIGARAVILPGVTIGHKSVIAAGTVVTKDVEPFSLVAGVPGKLIKKY